MEMDLIKLKACLIGATHVGKTSIANRYTRNLFSNRYIQTVGCDFYIKSIQRQDHDIKLIIYDIGGHIDVKQIRMRYLVGSDIVFIVADLNEPSSHDIAMYLEDCMALDSDPIITIVGNKLDLVDETRSNPRILVELAEKHDIPFLKTSAKQNIGIQEIFNDAVDRHLARLS